MPDEAVKLNRDNSLAHPFDQAGHREWRDVQALLRQAPRATIEPETPRICLSDKPQVDGKFLSVNGRRFFIKGVTYGTFPRNEEGEPYPPLRRVKADFAAMARAGINTVRLYSPPSARIADAAAEAGLQLVADICWGPRYCQLHRRQDLNAIYQWTRKHARQLAGHPAMLLYSIGNEIPPLLVRWYGHKRIEHFLQNLDEIVKDAAPGALTTYACHPPTEYLHLPFIDVVSFNVYLERENEFRRYLARLQNLAGARPLFLAELGLDSSAHGEAAQGEVLKWQLRAVFEKGLCGAAVYSWTDEWAIFAEKVDGWSFGLTTPGRKPKPALSTVSSIYRTRSFCELRGKNWPRVSVIVCSYNGAKTLAGCLRSLIHLNYPDYEVLVIDDGSTDNTGEIVEKHAVQYVRVDNGGLSAARNLGIKKSSGQIVAFIDSDARADSNWLYYLVSAMEEHGAAAVGGPNLLPREDGFVAQCVDHAPGNPTHVLRDDELAEHIPGCNMAYRKDALQQIGNFDAVYRAAGDDVDVCWKLLARNQKIVYHAGAMVWHHRRSTVWKYLRQQRGYGYAESQLRRRYPGRFNVFGHAVWTGSVYDAPGHAMRLQGFPRLMRPRIYHGIFGSAQFQSLYQPFHNWWIQIFTTIEWQGLVICIFAASLLAVAHSDTAVLLLSVLGVSLTVISASAALTMGIRAVRVSRSGRSQKVRSALLVAFLHLAQPWARFLGRLQGWKATRRRRISWPREYKAWGNLSQRDEWLRRLASHLTSCGWIARTGGDWNSEDIVVDGPGPYRVQLRSVTEEVLEKGFFFARWRVRAIPKWSGMLTAAVLIACLGLLATRWYLTPLTLAPLLWLYTLAKSRRRMLEGISQLAMEIAEGTGMSAVQEDPQ